MTLQCNDFLEFQDTIKKMREIDDKVIYALNTTIPTESFKGQVDATSKCEDLYNQLKTEYSKRENAIQRCVLVSEEKIKKIREQREADRDDSNILKKLRAEQTKLRMLQVELGVEEVVKQRSTKVFHERCRSFFSPLEKL